MVVSDLEPLIEHIIAVFSLYNNSPGLENIVLVRTFLSVIVGTSLSNITQYCKCKSHYNDGVITVCYQVIFVDYSNRFLCSKITQNIVKF